MRSSIPLTSYISWEGLTPPEVNLLHLSCWMCSHPTIKMEETFVVCKVVVDQGKCLPLSNRLRAVTCLVAVNPCQLSYHLLLSTIDIGHSTAIQCCELYAVNYLLAIDHVTNNRLSIVDCCLTMIHVAIYWFAIIMAFDLDCRLLDAINRKLDCHTIF